MPFSKEATEVRHSIPFLFYFIFRAGKSGIEIRRAPQRRATPARLASEPARPLDILHSIPFWLVVIEINAHSTQMDYKERKYEEARKSTEQIMYERKD